MTERQHIQNIENTLNDLHEHIKRNNHHVFVFNRYYVLILILNVTQIISILGFNIEPSVFVTTVSLAICAGMFFLCGMSIYNNRRYKSIEKAYDDAQRKYSWYKLIQKN